MKIGIVSDSLSNQPFETALDTIAGMGIEGVEINTGNWSSAPHMDLDAMLASSDARKRFMNAITSRGLSLIALNCNGNQLHPTDGQRQSSVVEKTIRLASELECSKVCLMSGLPAGAPTDKSPNWIISAWPPETSEILAWQWNEVLLPYWRKLVDSGRELGIDKFAIELHGNQLVYNVPTLLRLRDAVGKSVGANLDPSHLMWMGADALQAVSALGDAIHHVHAKDTWINPDKAATISRLDTGPMIDVAERAWSYITIGYGHGESWWREFCYRLRLVGYDSWLSIEHEDPVLSCAEGVQRSVNVLKSAAPEKVSDFSLQPI
ncbi:sugar phosphate isomerase/epimerase family protein [Thalassospira xianhensis]|uniref:Xylose isomerase-like TIM barrel domain-containing protein n=1 Tax=Thalassospira xianhensis MCCC 1A02616 TaxID=1177929 RepID=A0A367UBF9_9PROT|nr:sugar phosphate isomerase/epimerase [Thalassospira xianhensis]RCK05300.1 hypothetical protein TH5_14780 [Thalassospira xianhensis MCCC 1A02616]